MATVYLARLVGPAGFDKLVALKCVHAHLAKDRQFIEMFLDEARLVSRIRHPRVCSVFDVGFVDGRYYLAMDFLEGVSLAQLCQRLTEGALPIAQRCLLAATLVSQACEGLHAAHELLDESGHPLQVVHRDVSPQNLFVTWDGNLQVVDFGVARATGRMHQTLSSSLKGKLAYMSPEQLEDRDIDRRTDVWALGVVLWETLTLRRLFRKRTEPGTMHAVLEGPIPPPSTVAPGVPPELDRVVLRALHRDVAQRYPTTRAMAKELNRFASSWGVPMGESEVAELLEELMPEERQLTHQLVSGVRDKPRGEPEMTPASATLPGVRRGPVIAVALGTALLGASVVFGWHFATATDAAEAEAEATNEAVAALSGAEGEGEAEAEAEAGTDAAPAPQTPTDVVAPGMPASMSTSPRMRVPRDEPPREVVYGSLGVFTPGRSMEIIVQGRSYGHTPHSHIRLPVGVYQVRLRGEGADSTHTVTVTEAGARLVVPLD